MINLIIKKKGNCTQTLEVPERACIIDVPCTAFLVSQPDDWWNARPVMGTAHLSWGRWEIYVIDKIWSVNGRDFFLDGDLYLIWEGGVLRKATVDEAALHHDHAFIRVKPNGPVILYNDLDAAARYLKSRALGNHQQ